MSRYAKAFMLLMLCLLPLVADAQEAFNSQPDKIVGIYTDEKESATINVKAMGNNIYHVDIDGKSEQSGEDFHLNITQLKYSARKKKWIDGVLALPKLKLKVTVDACFEDEQLTIYVSKGIVNLAKIKLKKKNKQ